MSQIEMPSQKCPRNFCFTLNNYTSGHLKLLQEHEDKFSYIVWGQEVASTGTPHLQGYAECKDHMTLPAVKKIIGNAHIEKRKGSAKEAAGYCKKGTMEKPDGDKYSIYFDHPSSDWVGYEKGEISNQGRRSDLDSVKDSIVSGEATVDEIALTDPTTFHQYGRTLQKIEDVVLRKKFRTWMTTCVWLYGETGVGKSHIAFEGFNPDTHYVWKDDKGWQDGYTGQETVIINDFRGEIPYNQLLQLIDKWPHTVPRRGREPAPFLARHIIITSSLPPERIYHRRLAEDSIDQLARRIEVKELSFPKKFAIDWEKFYS